MKMCASSDWDQFFRCNVQLRFAFLCAHLSNSIRGDMYYIEISIVFCVFRAVNSNWIQIAQTSDDLPRQSLIDRSHFLASLNMDTADFIVNTPHSMIDTFREIERNQYNGYSDDIESKTKLFKHFTSTSSTLRDPLTTLDTIRISDLNLWPGDVSVENENVSQNIFSNTEAFFETTVPSLLNVTEMTIDSHSFLAHSVDDKSSNTRLKTPAKYVLKRVEFKPFDLPSVFGFLREMQKTFLSRSLSAIDDKVKYLEKFKDTVLTSIDKHFKSLWPSSVNVSRKKRAGHHGGGGGGMDIPSSETALMTISFLTLAVFLIKLVLQVIHTIKSKHFGTMQAASDTPIKIIKKNRNARRLSLLSSMEDLRSVTETIESIESGTKAYT